MGIFQSDTYRNKTVELQDEIIVNVTFHAAGTKFRQAFTHVIIQYEIK